MNLTTEQAQHVRERHAAGDAVIGLAVAGKERPIMPPPQTMDVTVRRTEFIPPADWVALTGVCGICLGAKGQWLYEGPHDLWRDCLKCHGEGRKRATFTAAEHEPGCQSHIAMPWASCCRGVPFAVATVEVVPVWGDRRPWPQGIGWWNGWVLTQGDGVDPEVRWHRQYFPDRQPEPGRDFVALLTDVELAS